MVLVFPVFCSTKQDLEKLCTMAASGATGGAGIPRILQQQTSKGEIEQDGSK